jgi:hypothetical protein
MVFVVDVLVENIVMLITVSGLTDLAEIRTGNLKVTEALSTGERPVHLILDVGQITAFPLAVSSVYEAAPFLRHPSLGYVIVVGDFSLMLRTIIHLFSQMAGFTYHLVETVDEAVAFLQLQDDRLNHDSAADTGAAL